MSLQYGELRPTSGGDPLASLRHPSKFQRVSRLGFITAATLLNGGQPNFAQCLAVSCTGIHYMHFWGFLPLTDFCQLQTSLCVQVLHSHILAALMYGTRAAAVGQTLWHGTRNGITELSQTAPPTLGWAAIMSGIGPHSSYAYFVSEYLPVYWCMYDFAKLASFCTKLSDMLENVSKMTYSVFSGM